MNVIEVSNLPPFRLRAARFIAWVHIVIGIIYASSLTYRFGSRILNTPDNIFFALAELVVFVFVYFILHAIIGTWCEVANDVLLGAVNAWPEALTIQRFFNHLREEAFLNMVRKTFQAIDLPEVAAIIPHRPHAGSELQSVLYMTTYFGCLFCAPLTVIISNVFWKVEIGLVVLFLAYLFTIPSISRRQS